MKPVSVAAVQTESGAIDQDAQLMREIFGLTDPPEQIAPVLATQRVVEGALRGEMPDYAARLREAYAAVSQGKDVVVLEGANTWAEGSLVDLSADQVSDHARRAGAAGQSLPLLGCRRRYRGGAALPGRAAAGRGDQPGAAAAARFGALDDGAVPGTAGGGGFRALAHDPQLEAPTVHELHEHLGGQS